MQELTSSNASCTSVNFGFTFLKKNIKIIICSGKTHNRIKPNSGLIPTINPMPPKNNENVLTNILTLIDTNI